MSDRKSPGVITGDVIFFRHPAGTDRSGRVRACGKHGVTVHCNGKDHRVKWDGVLGHKRRAEQHYDLAERGEDGHLIKDAAGKHRFIRVPGDALEDQMIAKADKPGGPFTGRPGLTLKEMTDSRGRKQGRWVRTDKDQPKERKKAVPEAGAAAGYGTHNLQSGDKVSFKAGDFSGSGTIVGRPGRDGVHVKDSSGRMHRVNWDEITGHDKGGAKKPEVQREVKSSQEPIPARKFVASDYAKSHDDAAVTPESIIAQFPADTADKIRDVQDRLAQIEQTIDEHSQDGEYSLDRQKKHREIVKHFLSPERIKAATPDPGEEPTLTLLGGRGGSGKSWFKGKAYDPNKTITIDADEIKGMLPEYEGWNAFQVHEESSDLSKRLARAARELGLNVVIDATMQSSKSPMRNIKDFKSSGYRVEAHYMHLPRQEAAKRAVSRFLGKTKRYVPVDIVLGNQENEAVFDEIRKHADKWSFRDNNVAMGEEPVLVSESESLIKSDNGAIVLLWRRS